MEIKNILLVGCGEIGSRHLQALAKMEIPIRIWAIDPSSISLKTAKVRFEEIPINKNIQSIKFESEIPENLDHIDLCIISTTSKIRFFVFKQIIDKVSCKNFIFEKVLFQKEEHFIQMLRLLKIKK